MITRDINNHKLSFILFYVISDSMGIMSPNDPTIIEVNAHFLLAYIFNSRI